MMGLTSSRPGSRRRCALLAHLDHLLRTSNGVHGLVLDGSRVLEQRKSSPAWDATRPKISPLPSRSRPPSHARGQDRGGEDP